jgi:hypothetical protein
LRIFVPEGGEVTKELRIIYSKVFQGVPEGAR